METKNMGHQSTKSKARKYFKEHPTVTKRELKDIFPEVAPATISKYLIEFKKLYGVKPEDAPDTISISKLEKELALQLELTPSSSVIKSCIDFLKLKQMSDEQDDDFDMNKFIKLGKGEK